jgi:hypothetical protein
LPDGGLLVASRAAERDRLLVIHAGRDLAHVVRRIHERNQSDNLEFAL